MDDQKKYFPALGDVMAAEHTLGEILSPTPLIHNRTLSERYGAEVMLKREDLQVVRSYKIRGAYNKIRSLTPEQTQRGIVCAKSVSSCVCADVLSTWRTIDYVVAIGEAVSRMAD